MLSLKGKAFSGIKGIKFNFKVLLLLGRYLKLQDYN